MKGFSILKRPLIQFFRHVHITSEKSYSINKDIAREIVNIIDFENKRIETMNFEMNLTKYIDYLIDGILPLYSGYLERKNHSGQNEDDDEHDQE